MSILLDKLRISGFRGIKEVEISLSRSTLLIGANNSGKTSVIKALQLALGDYSRYLTDDDFHIAHDDSKHEEIIVDVRIVPRREEGSSRTSFTDEWTQEFGDNISASPINDDVEPQQFVAIRTIASRDRIKGGFVVKRYALERWPSISFWKSERININNRIRGQFEAVPFIAVSSQRDIHQELRDRTSYIGKILSTVKYSHSDILTSTVSIFLGGSEILNPLFI